MLMLEGNGTEYRQKQRQWGCVCTWHRNQLRGQLSQTCDCSDRQLARQQLYSGVSPQLNRSCHQKGGSSVQVRHKLCLTVADCALPGSYVQ